jgi:hypothetical protein
MEQHIHAAQSLPLVRSMFSGLLHQRELSERLYFIKSRILNGHSQEDMAFLLGRSTEGLETL